MSDLENLVNDFGAIRSSRRRRGIKCFLVARPATDEARHHIASKATSTITRAADSEHS